MRWTLLLLCALAGAACQGEPRAIVVGKKAFVEQDILAEIVAATIEASGAGATEVRGCGDTFGCQQALRAGEIDLMVEYTGTGHLYSSASASGAPVSLEQLRASYAALGLAWLDSLGFDNGYRVVIPTSRARMLGIDTIGELVELDGGTLRVAVPPTYLRRPGDGLGALLSRHGLRSREEPLAIAAVDERVDALREGRADVAILYATDGALQSSELTVLDDSLGFFPPYEAAILAREDTLDASSGLRDALGRLAGTLDEATMQQLNRAVQVEGWRPEVIARRFLREQGLVTANSQAIADAPPVRVAVTSAAELDVAIERAIRAVRQSFPDRPAVPVPVRDPAEALAAGRARLAVLGAERFFERDARGRLRRSRGIEAVAVVGSRLAHLVRRRDDDAAALSGRLGAPPEDSGAGTIASAILGADVARRGTTAELLDDVAGGRLDAALIVTRAGDPALARAIEGGLALRPLPIRDAAAATPFLRPARLAAGTYPGQTDNIETLAAQVLVAGPARAETGAPFGPAAALTGAPQPLTLAEAEALVRATGTAESPDPALPSAWTTWPTATDRGDAAGAAGSWLDTLLNLGTLVFLVWVLGLLGRSELGKSLSDERS